MRRASRSQSRSASVPRVVSVTLFPSISAARAESLRRMETRETIGGYWMIQVNSKAEAVEWASRCPASDKEVIEVRQVQELADFPADVQAIASGFSEMRSDPNQRKER